MFGSFLDGWKSRKKLLIIGGAVLAAMLLMLIVFLVFKPLQKEVRDPTGELPSCSSKESSDTAERVNRRPKDSSPSASAKDVPSEIESRNNSRTNNVIFTPNSQAASSAGDPAEDGYVEVDNPLFPKPNTKEEFDVSVDFNVSTLPDITNEFLVHEGHILENFRNLYNAKVVKVEDTEYPYRLWIFGETVSEGNPLFDGYDAIFYGRGKDLDHWEMYCGGDDYDTTMNPDRWMPVMTAGSEDFDSFHNGDPSVVYKDGVFYMAFSSVGLLVKDGYKNYIVNCVMGAESRDGIHWTKSKQPILIWEKEYEESWAADTPVPPSTGGYHRPSLLFDEGKWKIWFDYYLPGTFLAMGYAECEGDFLNAGDWKIVNAEYDPQLKNWPNPAVTKIGDTYYAFSDAPGYDASNGPQFGRQITMAVSKDGKQWEVIGKMNPEPGYGTHLPEPYVEVRNGKTWLYIFYSVVDDSNYPCYNRLNYMKKPLD